MTLKCPNCGQLLKSEPGKRGMCPYCRTEVVFPDGDPMTGELITCPHCGQNQRYRDGRCINCGKPLVPSLEDSFNSKNGAKKKGKGKKKFIIIIAAILIVVAGVLFARSQGFGLTDDEKNERIARAYVNDGYDAAMELVVKYYGTDSDMAYTWAAFILDMEDDEIIEELEIVEHSMVLDGDYYYYDAQVKNNSDATITYMRIDIYMYNEDGEIMDTDWTNWSGTLPPGASTHIDAMVRDTGGLERFREEISDITTE